MEKKVEKKPALTVSEMAAMGGNARAKGLTKKRRKEIASEAAKARWADKKAETKTT
jgi:hypothetical protein